MASALTSMQVDVAAAPPGQHYAPHDLMPLTPRQGDAMDEHDEHEDDRFDESPQTPTRHSFCGLPGQRPLPDQPLKAPTGLAAVVRSALHDIDDDVDMGEADGDTVVDDDLSDNDSITSESQRPNKKKKGQRFFCTEFPPCQLSFTRSEHLARHIRKHTGERPFQCHCSRRFSRLDNLRQHAQTVHVNEEIPGDSLAATSTRFQRQVRTDRVRPTGSRPRTNTVGSQNGTPNRGHHARNLSTSSIASTTSNASMADDAARRWQQPLAIAADSQRPSMFDEYSHSSQTHRSMMGLNTPTSQAYPNYVSGYASPSSTISRSSYYGEPRHNRRQSVPTSPNPYQSNPYAAGQFTPTSMRGSVYSGAPSGFASPTSSIFSQGRVEGESEVEYRRRTWHPNTQSNYAHRPATSGLSYHQTPDEEKPNLSQQPAASQLTRLPGIESFDYVPPVPIRQPTSPAMVEQHRPLDQALHQGLHRLDLTSSNVQQEQHWPRPELRPEHFGRPPPLLRNAEPVHPVHYMSMPEPPTTPMRSKRQAWYGGPIAAAQAPVLQPALGSLARTSPEDSGSSDGIATPAYPQEHHPVILNQAEPQPAMHMLVDEKPNVYGQSGAHVLTSPDRQHKPILPARSDSGFQKASQARRFPIAVHTEPYSFRLQSGYDPRLASVTPHQSPTSARGLEDMGRLEALVAVATSERPVDELRR